MGGGKNDSPPPPDYSKLAQASVESAEIWADVAREQLAWAKTTDANNRALLERVLGVQLPQLEAAFNQAQEDRQRWEDVFRPIEDNLIKEFQEYDTPEKREQEAATRMADVNTAFDAQRRNAEMQLADYGIDPSQIRSGALDLGYRAQQAAATAMAANQGRGEVEQMGRALRAEALNIGRGYPAQVAQAQGIVNQTAGGAVGNAVNTTNAGVNAYGSAYGAGNLSQQGYMNAGNLQNMGYQNALAGWQANANSQAGFWGGLGQLAGTGLGVYGMKYFSEGGEAEEDGSAIPDRDDRIPAMLSKGEYVIPKEVVQAKGTEFFDKLLERYGEKEAPRKRQAVS